MDTPTAGIQSGDALMLAYWKDSAFDPKQHAL
jgi:hypothetical protein